ncbi:MAG TPA: pyridoxal phosphate-dependent aminotransferase family protein [Candidatus Obscuribacterales bacterium]
MVLVANHSTAVTIAGKDYLYFGGTNYLGLAHRQEIIEAVDRAFEAFGFSAGASRLTSGEHEILLSLEQEQAKFANAERSVVLPAGFLSNQVVVDALDDVVDIWVMSKNAHSSIQSALRLSRKPIITSDLDVDTTHFRQRFDLPSEYTLGIFAEPIDPLMGRLVNMQQLMKIVSPRDYLILDEAHSFGTLGARGVGALEQFAMLPSDKLVRTGTFSKALGAYGGFVLGSGDTIDLIKQRSSAYKGSTALPPPVCAAAREGLRVLINDHRTTIDLLKSNIAWLNERLAALKIAGFVPAQSPIFYLPNSPPIAKARELLFERGIYLPTISSYFGDFCEIGLRWTIQAGHSESQMSRLVDTIKECL